MRVGEWELLEYIPSHMEGDKRVRARWKCRCSCGTERAVEADRLHVSSGPHVDPRKKSTSCGDPKKHFNAGHYTTTNQKRGNTRTHMPRVGSVFELGALA